MISKAPLCANFNFAETLLRTYWQIFRPSRPTVFEKIKIFDKKTLFSEKKSISGRNSNLNYCYWTADFIGIFSVLFGVGLSITSFVTFFKVGNTWFSWPNWLTILAEKWPFSRKQRDFQKLLAWKSFCKLDFQNCFVKSLQLLVFPVC